MKASKTLKAEYAGIGITVVLPESEARTEEVNTFLDLMALKQLLQHQASSKVRAEVDQLRKDGKEVPTEYKFVATDFQVESNLTKLLKRRAAALLEQIEAKGVTQAQLDKGADLYEVEIPSKLKDWKFEHAMAYQRAKYAFQSDIV